MTFSTDSIHAIQVFCFCFLCFSSFSAARFRDLVYDFVLLFITLSLLSPSKWNFHLVSSPEKP